METLTHAATALAVGVLTFTAVYLTGRAWERRAAARTRLQETLGDRLHNEGFDSDGRPWTT